MNLRTLHYLADLACDAVEAIIHCFHSNHAADELWCTCVEKRLVEKEAEEEVLEPRNPYFFNDSMWPQSSPAARVVSADTAAGETPADSAPPSVAVGGHPNLTPDERDWASFALRRYADQYPVTRANLYCIADKLDPAK